MSVSIWKYPVKVEDNFMVEMPLGADVLSVQVQGGVPQMWARVTTDAKLEKRFFAVHGTGHVIPDDGREFIGAFQLLAGGLVFHLFEVQS